MATYLNYWWPQLPLWAGIAVFGVALIVAESDEREVFRHAGVLPVFD